MGLDTLLSQGDAVEFSRRTGTCMWLCPENLNVYWSNLSLSGLNVKGFTFVRKNQNSKSDFFVRGQLNPTSSYIPVDYNEIYSLIGADLINDLHQYYYLNDRHYGVDNNFLKAPPVKRLFNVYGVNMPTEKLYFYKALEEKMRLDVKADPDVPYHTVREGIAYETEFTPQKFLVDQNRRFFQRSGDGTITYESLTYPEFWKNELELKTSELYGCEHRDTIATEAFFRVFVPYVCQK